MLIFFSGDTSMKDVPESVLKPEPCHGVMLTYWDIIEKKNAVRRFELMERIRKGLGEGNDNG
jgi:hypothetical protein